MIKKTYYRTFSLDITLSKLEKILQSDEESDAGYKENTTKNISSPEINLSVNESVNPESVSQKSSSPRTKGNMASADPSCYQVSNVESQSEYVSKPAPDIDTETHYLSFIWKFPINFEMKSL